MSSADPRAVAEAAAWAGGSVLLRHLRGDLEVAGSGAGQFNGAPACRRAPRHQFRHNPVGGVLQLKSVGVADRQHEADNHPYRGHLGRRGEAAAEHARQGAADQDQEANPVQERQLLVIIQSRHGAAVAQRDDHQCAAEGKQSHHLQRAAHVNSPLRTLTLRSLRSGVLNLP